MSLTATAIILTGCSKPDQPPIGKEVIVQLRRDALGSGQTPIGPTVGNINGVKVFLSGKLVSVNEEWIVLEYDKQKHWIPVQAVLLIKINK